MTRFPIGQPISNVIITINVQIVMGRSKATRWKLDAHAFSDTSTFANSSLTLKGWDFYTSPDSRTN